MSFYESKNVNNILVIKYKEKHVYFEAREEFNAVKRQVHFFWKITF